MRYYWLRIVHNKFMVLYQETHECKENKNTLLHRYKISQFLASVPILHPLKTLGNLWFSGVFRVYNTRTFASNGLLETTTFYLLFQN